LAEEEFLQMRLRYVLIGFALAGPASAGGVQFAENEVKHYADNEVVQFVNQMSDVVSVRVDGADACQLAPGETCTARLSGTDGTSNTTFTPRRPAALGTTPSRSPNAIGTGRA
jgi:hypothetical protein